MAGEKGGGRKVARLSHPNGCVIEFQPIEKDGRELVRVTSSRPGRATWSHVMGRWIATLNWKAWLGEGFSPMETQGD